MGAKCCAGSGEEEAQLRYVPDAKRAVESPEPSVISQTYSSWRAGAGPANTRINTDMATGADFTKTGAGQTPDTLHTPKPDPGWHSVGSNTPSHDKDGTPISPMPTDDETMSISFHTLSPTSSQSNCLSRLNWSLISSKLKSFQSRLIEPAGKRDKRERWIEDHKIALKKASDKSKEKIDESSFSDLTTTAVWKFVNEVASAADQARVISVGLDSTSSLDDPSSTVTETVSMQPRSDSVSTTMISSPKQLCSEYREIESKLLNAVSSHLGCTLSEDRAGSSLSSLLLAWHSAWLSSWETTWMSEFTLGMQYAWDCIWCAIFLCYSDHFQRNYQQGQSSTVGMQEDVTVDGSTKDKDGSLIRSPKNPRWLNLNNVAGMIVHLDELICLPSCRIDSVHGFSEVTRHNSVAVLYLSRFLNLCKFPECGKLMLGYHCCLHSPHLTSEVIRELAVNADRDYECAHPELPKDTKHLLEAAVESIDPDEIDPSVPVNTSMLVSLHACVASLSALFADHGLDHVFGQIFGKMN